MYPFSFDGQDLNVDFHEGILGFTCLKGTLFVSAFIIHVGSELPMGLKRNLYDLSFVGIKIWFLKTYGM
jgi:hypothetical protein